MVIRSPFDLNWHWQPSGLKIEPGKLLEEGMKTQLEYYIENQDELVNKYNNQIITVKDGKYMGTFNSRTEALREMKKQGHVPGTFMVILCRPGDGEYTAYFHGDVIFSDVRLEQ
jgi:hypothetical protein